MDIDAILGKASMVLASLLVVKISFLTDTKQGKVIPFKLMQCSIFGDLSLT